MRCARGGGLIVGGAEKIILDALERDRPVDRYEVAVIKRVRGLLTQAALLIATLAAGAATGCGGTDESAPVATSTPRPIPSPVSYRPEPEGITLADPAFEALPGAHADFGRLGGAAYQIEIADNWNGRLVLHMHGFEEFAPEARATAPDFRRFLVGHGYAWGASSFSSTSSIPGRSADETAALWDYFVRKYGRPERTYATGLSMGGAASHIAAERYPDRFDGALALCGSAGHTAGFMGLADYFAAGAYVAGVTQTEFDASSDSARLIQERILARAQDVHRAPRDGAGPRRASRPGQSLRDDRCQGDPQSALGLRLAKIALARGLVEDGGRRVSMEQPGRRPLDCGEPVHIVQSSGGNRVVRIHGDSTLPRRSISVAGSIRGRQRSPSLIPRGIAADRR